MGAGNAAATPFAYASRHHGITTVTLVVLCQVFHGLTFGGIALFLPLIREDLQMSFAQGGMLSTAATLSYALGQIPSGFLSDRLGPNVVLSLAGPLLAQAMGWRSTFIAFAILGIAGALVYRALAHEKSLRGSSPAAGVRDALRFFRHRILWVCSALQFVRFSVVTAFNFWLPSLLVADRAFSLPAAGLVTAMSAVLTVSSNAAGGYVSDRLRNPPLVIGGSLAVLACTTTLLVWWTPSQRCCWSSP
ncbi:MAG: MFS transporter [Betaproteobacteria bacterium]|nr:MFS transporter [Betaproteobacteria bacterium]